MLIAARSSINLPQRLRTSRWDTEPWPISPPSSMPLFYIPRHCEISSWNSRWRTFTVPSGPLQCMQEWIRAVLKTGAI